MMHFVYEIRVTLPTKKSTRSGPDGWQRCQRYAVRPGSHGPAPNFIPPSIHCPAVNGFAELKFIWNVGDRSPLTFAALMMGHHVSMVMGEEHLGRLLIARWSLLTRSTRRRTARDVRTRCARHEPFGVMDPERP